MGSRALEKVRRPSVKILLATMFVMILGVGTAFAADEIGARTAFYGNSGFSYLGYSSMSHINGYFDSTQRTQCTSTNAPIGNMKSNARLTTVSYYVASSKSVTNTSTYSRYTNLTATTGTYNNTQFSDPLMGAGISSCWKNGGWYDVLTGKTATATRGLDCSDPEMTVNSAGQVCGTVSAVEKGMHVDLVRAYATNGEKGYVYYDELREAENSGMGTPEEAVETMAERRIQSANAIKTALNENLAGTAGVRNALEITNADGEAVLDAYYGVIAEGGSPSDSNFISAVKKALPSTRSLSSLASVDEVVLEKSIEEARDVVREYIPVYSEDGVTVIGQYPIEALI